MSRSIRDIARQTAPAAPGAAGDEQTTVMSRALLPFPARRSSNPPPPSIPSSSKKPRMALDDQTMVDFVRPGVIEGEHTLNASFLGQQAPRSTSSVPRPDCGSRPPPSPASTRRPSVPPPLPASAFVSESPRPTLVPPPPQSGTNLFQALQAPESLRPGAPPASVSSPALVSDILPSVPPPAPEGKMRREPMLLLAAGLGVLGMIFTMGIVVGLVVSLRGSAAEGSRGPAAAGVGTGVAVPVISQPVVAAVAPVAVVPAAPVVSAPAAVPVEAPKAAPVEKVAVAAPVKVAAPPARVVRAAVASAPVRVAAAQAAPAAAKRGRVAAVSDPDFDAANAASSLARAQLEASLK